MASPKNILITRAGHLRKDKDGAVRLNLIGVNAQSVLVTQSLLRLWKDSEKWVQGRVLDVGCGSQPYRLMFEGRYTEWIGLDRAPSRMPGYPLDLQADAQVLPFRNETFDTVVASEVLEHLPQPEKLWSEAHRVLKPGGKILLSVPFLYWIHEYPHDYQRFTECGLVELATRYGFRILSLKPRGGVLTVQFDLFFKILSGGFGLANKLKRRLFGQSSKQNDLRESILGRVLLAWPQLLLGALLKDDCLMSDKITCGYMVVAEKIAEKPV